MISLSRFQCNFIANWKFGVLALLGCLFFVRLGLWQLARAEEKKQLIAAHQQLASQTPTLWHTGDALPVQYQPIRIRGHFSPIVLLLDNQHYQHQFGYDVLSPLILEDGRVVLVDRGFVAADATREKLPEVSIPVGEQEWLGTAYFPSTKSWALGNIFDRKQSNMVVIELFDARLVGQFLHKSVYPFIMRLNPLAPNGFVRDWSVVSMPASRHTGYAVQWFAMAFVSVMLFIVLNIKKKP